MISSLTPEQIALIAASLGMPKLLIKLLDVIQQGVGTISEPFFIRKKAEALADGKAYELKKLIETIAESQNLIPLVEYRDGQIFIPSKSQNDLNLLQRAENRFEYQQERKQLNTESVIANAFDEANNSQQTDSDVSDEPVDPDWITRFFQIIEGISDEQMQQLWGKILAGEIKSPNTFSLRTLELLRNLKKEEAEVFCKVGELASEATNKFFIADFNNNMYLSERNQFVSFMDILILKEIGLLYSETLSLNFDSKGIDTPSHFIYGNQVVRFYHEAKITLTVLVFTKVGEELLTLLPKKFDPNYLKFLCKPIYSSCNKLVYSPLLSIKNNLIHYGDEEIEIFPKPSKEEAEANS